MTVSSGYDKKFSRCGLAGKSPFSSSRVGWPEDPKSRQDGKILISRVEEEAVPCSGTFCGWLSA
jgi:hypothetical protein